MLNTREERELAVYKTKPENQAELVPGPDPDQKKIFFQKIEPTILLVQHVKGQPGAPTYVWEKGYIKCDTNRVTPCIIKILSNIEFVIHHCVRELK